MKANILGSILGLLAVSTIAGGIVFVAPKISENMGTAVGNAPEEIVSAERVEGDENLSDDLTTDLLTIEKEEEETVVNKEEPKTEEEIVVEETDEKAETEKPEEKITETAKTVTETIEAATETANVAEEVVAETTETTAETPTETVEQPTQTTTETVAETPTEQPTGDADRSEWKPLFAPIENPANDSERMYNEMVSSTSMEEFMQRQEALNNASFDGNGNLVDPSMITSEPETSTATEVTEEIVIEE